MSFHTWHVPLYAIFAFPIVMFRWVTTILFLLVILLQIAGKWLILADYALNKEYIARTLCINKSKPAMHCNGKCHLRKQLQQEENGGEQAPARSGHQKFQEVIFEPLQSVTVYNPLPVSTTFTTNHTNLYTSQYTASVFHPPGV